jgi:hypothetical protein
MELKRQRHHKKVPQAHYALGVSSDFWAGRLGVSGYRGRPSLGRMHLGPGGGVGGDDALATCCGETCRQTSRRRRMQAQSQTSTEDSQLIPPVLREDYSHWKRHCSVRIKVRNTGRIFGSQLKASEFVVSTKTPAASKHRWVFLYRLSLRISDKRGGDTHGRCYTRPGDPFFVLRLPRFQALAGDRPVHWRCQLIAIRFSQVTTELTQERRI